MTRETPPLPMAQWFNGRLIPAGPYDEEELQRHPQGTMFDLKARTRRSHPQLRTYWKALGVAVEATGRWPSREALHKALKVACGLVEPILNLRGEVVGMQAHSIALDKMTASDFKAYFDKAMGMLADATGFDPLAFLQ